MGTLETVGLVTVAGIGGVVLFMLYRRRAQLARGFSSVRDVLAPEPAEEAPAPRRFSPSRVIDVPPT